MYYERDGTLIEYRLLTDPPEAVYWLTYKLKKSDIKLVTKFDRSTAAQIKQEIYEDILENDIDKTALSTRSRPTKKQRSSSNAQPRVRTHVRRSSRSA